MKVLSAKEFYVQSIDEKPPKIDSKKWRLSLDGLFKNPLMLNYDQIRARESMTQMTSLACIGNEVGGQQIGNARWTGFRLRDLLEEAGLDENAKKIIFYCEDIYSTAIEIQSLLNDNVMLSPAADHSGTLRHEKPEMAQKIGCNRGRLQRLLGKFWVVGYCGTTNHLANRP